MVPVKSKNCFKGISAVFPQSWLVRSKNPEDWWTAVQEGVRELTADFDKKQIGGISFGGQMHGLVILDKDDQVIRPAILWNDGRTTKRSGLSEQRDWQG